jgi:predicted GIY-YIG superfamily endonuclease
MICRMKYIYLIQSLEEGYYKIGISKNPTKRLQQLQTGNASSLKLIDIYYTDFADKIERALQRRYAHLHKEGEWFDLSITEEVGFKEECRKIEETIVFLKKNGNVFI